MSSVEGASRRRHAVLTAAIAVLLTALPAAADETAEALLASRHLIIRTSVEPEEVLVGQRADLVVEILTRTWFLQAPRYPDTLNVDDAVVLPPETFGVNLSERVDGETYAGQRRTFSIFPTRTGEYSVPSFTITLKVADEQARPTPELALATPPTIFRARVAEAARGHGLVLATPRLSASESLDPPPSALRVGDSVRRAVILEIEDSVAMLLPEVAFHAPAGSSVYPDRSHFEDRRNRGRMTGTRTQSATFIVEEEGELVLPAIEVRWWDLGSNRLRTETLAGGTYEVSANPELAVADFGFPEEEATAEEVAPPVSQLPSWRTVLAALAGLIVGAVALRAGWRALRRTRSPRAGPSEEELFRRFRRAARQGSAPAALNALYAWSDHVRPEGPGALSWMIVGGDDPGLSAQLAGLQKAAMGGDADWSAASLVNSLQRARRRLRHAPGASGREGRLGPLNPKARMNPGAS